MNRSLCLLALGAALVAAACGDNNDKVAITLFAAAPDAIEEGDSTRLLFVVSPPNAKVTITELGDVSGKTEAMVSPTTTTTYQLVAKKGSAEAEATVTVTVGPKATTGLKIVPATATPTAGDMVAVTVTALAPNGMPSPGYRGTVHLTSSDPTATLPADFKFEAVDAGVKTVMVTLKTAGLNTLTGTDVMKPGTTGTAALTVRPGAATAYQLTALPASAIAGDALVLTITARDMFGNIATGYAGQATLTSTDPTDILPAAGAFTGGVRVVSVTFVKSGSHFATVSEVVSSGIAAVDTTTVTIGAASPFKIEVTAPNAATVAGTAEPFTAKLVDVHGNTCTNFTGTVHFASSDPGAIVPADYTYTVADAGSHDFAVTLKTAGIESVTVTEVASPAAGSIDWLVGAAAAADCTMTQAPIAAVAGSLVGVTVTVHDAFGNLATTYAGTVRLTATDFRAVLPGDVTFIPLSDAGSHAFSVALLTTGSQTVTATDIADGAIECSAAISITPGAPKLVVALPANANAGYAVGVDVAVKDIFDNPIPTFAGTVTFTNSDTGTGAVTPAPITFTGSEGGVGSSSATFVTIGGQLIGASAGTATGNAGIAVHGLVYSAPTAGRVRLVANTAQSNTQVVQLDLVANERLEMSTFFGGGPGSFAAGMNLPIDTTRVGADTVLFAPGPVLPAGTGTRAAAGRIGSDSVLYTVVSRKRSAATIFTQATEVQAGGVFYSVRLKLLENGSVGPVFDGAQLTALFRAAIRDQWGDDFVNQGEFGLGKLEVR